MIQRALLSQDIPRAISLLAQSLHRDPNDPHTLALTAQLLAISSDQRTLLRMVAQPSIPHRILKARLQGLMGHHWESWRAALRLTSEEPGLNCLRWFELWLSDSERASNIDPREFMRSLLPAPRLLPPQDLAHHETWASISRVLLRLLEAHPEEPSLRVHLVRAWSNSQDHDKAIQLAQDIHAQERSSPSALTLARALRASTQWEEALLYGEEALRLDPSQIEVHLEVAELAEECDRKERALAAYEIVLKKMPTHLWAKGSALYLRYALRQDNQARKALLDLWAQNPLHPRLSVLAERALPWLGFFPWSMEATFGTQDNLNLQDSSLQLPRFSTPSARMVMMRLLDDEPSPASPPPRVHHRTPPMGITPPLGLPSVGTTPPLGTRIDPFQHLQEAPPGSPITGPLPREGLLSTLNQITAQGPMPWKARTALTIACARTHGQGRERDLLTWIHSPPHPISTDWNDWDWVQHFQINAALVLAFLDRNWRASRSRRILYELLQGDDDWTVGAAALALATLAHRNHVALEEVGSWLLLRTEKSLVQCETCRSPLLVSALIHPQTSQPNRVFLLSALHDVESRGIPPL